MFKQSVLNTIFRRQKFKCDSCLHTMPLLHQHP